MGVVTVCTHRWDVCGLMLVLRMHAVLHNLLYFLPLSLLPLSFPSFFLRPLRGLIALRAISFISGPQHPIFAILGRDSKLSPAYSRKPIVLIAVSVDAYSRKPRWTLSGSPVRPW
jgi:hypothetical protein